MLDNDNHLNVGRLASFIYAGDGFFCAAAGSLNHPSRVAGEVEVKGWVNPRVGLIASDYKLLSQRTRRLLCLFEESMITH